MTITAGGVFAGVLFGLLRHFNLLRVDQMTELAGIDNIDHGGPAYPEFIDQGSAVRGQSSGTSYD